MLEKKTTGEKVTLNARMVAGISQHGIVTRLNCISYPLSFLKDLCPGVGTLGAQGYCEICQ